MTRRLAIFFALLCGCAAARDWARYPAVAQVDGAPEIFAVGDAHGDYARLARALRTAGIIGKDDAWTAGRAVLVTTGDMIDKGPRALEVLRLLRRLRETAPAAGGRAIVLAGNHEAEFLANPGAPKGREFAEQLQTIGVRAEDVAACKGEWGEFLCTLPFAARVNDVFFSHAGNSGGRSVERLERDIEEDFDARGFAAGQLTGNGSLLEARLNGTGPGREPWIDAGLPRRGEKQLLGDYARALGVAYIVQGHVPSAVKFADGVKRERGEMFQRYGLLFLIDTGMSEGVDESEGAVLRLTPAGGMVATAICPDGTATALWAARAPEDTGRAARCGRPPKPAGR